MGKPKPRVTVLADTMYNMHQSSGCSDEYRKGLMVGVVGGLMAGHGLTFHQAIAQCAFHMPDAGCRISPASVPEAWFVDIGRAMEALQKTYICSV